MPHWPPLRKSSPPWTATSKASTFTTAGMYAGSRYRYADLTLRIPVEKLEEFTAAVDSLSNVVSSSRNTEDVTLQYVDTESRVKALETERDRLLELMEQAETMSDLLEIESRLTEVRGELERYASQLKVLDNQIDYATVNLSLSEVTEYTPVVEKTRLEKIRDGFVSSVKGVGNLILDFISFVLMNIPYILLFGLILWGLLALVKRHRRKHPKKPKGRTEKRRLTFQGAAKLPPLSLSKKPRRVWRRKPSNKIKIIFCRGVYLTENTSQAASLAPQRCAERNRRRRLLARRSASCSP